MKRILELGAIAGIGIGLLATTNQPVQAASSYKVKVTKQSFVYDKNGKRQNTFWYKNSVLRASGTKKINGKVYYKLEGKKGGCILKNTAKKLVTHTNKSADANKVDDSVDSQFRAQVQTEFIKLVNNWRKTQKSGAMKADSGLKKFATLRAQDQVVAWKQTGDLDNHKGFYNYNSAGKAECLGIEPKTATAKALAEAMVDKLIYHDESSNWVHRDILKANKYHKIGVGVAANDEYYTYAVELK